MFLKKEQLLSLLGLLLCHHAVHAYGDPVDPALNVQLRNAVNQLGRSALLPDDSDWVFDFTQQKQWTFAPGSVVNANAVTFPAATGYGMTVATLNLGPCSMLPPHQHPRATNFVVAVSGTTDTYMIQENGARTVKTTLDAGKLTIFPAGSIHWMENTGCENAQLISALNSEDTGTLNIAASLFSMPAPLLNAALGYADVDLNRTAEAIPKVGTGSIYGSKECLARCAKRRPRRT